MAHHVMNRLDARGHGPIARWSEDAASRAEAGAEFAKHQALGYTMYDISEATEVFEWEDPETGVKGRISPGEAIGRKLDAFDADASEILAVPRMVAG